MIEFFISSLQMNALNVNKKKSRELLLKNRVYNLLMQWEYDFWNSLVLDDIAETLEWGTFIDIELSFMLDFEEFFYVPVNLFSQVLTVLLVSFSNLK